MRKPTQVEILVYVRHRDGDFNIVGKAVNRSIVLELEDFDAGCARIPEGYVSSEAGKGSSKGDGARRKKAIHFLSRLISEKFTGR